MGDGSTEMGDRDEETRGRGDGGSIFNPKSKIQNTPISHLPSPISHLDLVVLNFDRYHLIATFNRIDDIHIFGLTENSVYAI
jgi:hypothetical protein